MTASTTESIGYVDFFAATCAKHGGKHSTTLCRRNPALFTMSQQWEQGRRSLTSFVGRDVKRVPLVLDRLSHAIMRHMVVVAEFTE